MPLPLVALVVMTYPGKPPQRERAGSGKEGPERPAHVSVDPDPGDKPEPTMDPSVTFRADADPSVPGLLLSIPLSSGILGHNNNNNNIYAGEPRRVSSCESDPP
jgi:hypothetical protein